MNIFFRIFIMAFLNGATAALYTVIFNREISCQTGPYFSQMKWVVVSFLAGSLIAVSVLRRTALKNADEGKINMTAALAPVINSFFVPAMIFLIRLIRPALSVSAGIAGPVWMGPLLCVAAYLPAAALSTAGFMPLVELPKKEKSNQAMIMLYASEIAGVIAAAALYFFILVNSHASVDIIYVAGIINLATVYFFFRSREIQGRFIMLATIAALIVYMGFNIAGIKEKTDTATARAQFFGYTVIADKEYPTMKFTMAKKDGVYYIFENGGLVYSVPNPDYMKTAWLAQGPKVLVINGGSAGLIEELSGIKGVAEITSVEEDPYTAFVMDKIFKPAVKEGKKVNYISGNGSLDPSIINSGRVFDSVILSCVRPLPGKYDSDYMRKIRDNFLKPGGTMIVYIARANTAETFDAVKSLFKSSSLSQGTITAK
jgi:hypothetical protein